MRINFTDKTLLNYVNKGIDKNTMFTDITGMRVVVRPTSNQEILASHAKGEKSESLVGIYFKCIINKDNKRQVFNLGSYPLLTLDEARKQYLDLVIKVRNGTLEAEKEEERKSVTFGDVYEEWKKIKFSKIKDNTKKKYNSVTRRHLYAFYNEPINKITAHLVLDNLNKTLVEQGKCNTADYVANIMRSVLDYAVFKELIDKNTLNGISNFIQKGERRHYLTFSDATLEEDMTKLFAIFARNNTQHQTVMLYMYFFTLLRNKELRTAKFENYQGDSLVIKTKTLERFRVPLTTQAQKCIAWLKRHHAREDNPYLFEGTSADGCVSDGTLNKNLRSCGYGDKLKIHGIRSCGRQFMQTIPTAKESTIEMCLSHAGGSQVQQAYNRGEYFDERLRVMQIWCDFVEKCIGSNFAFIND